MKGEELTKRTALEPGSDTKSTNAVQFVTLKRSTRSVAPSHAASQWQKLGAIPEADWPSRVLRIKYDRLYGGMLDGGAIFTKPSTVKVVQPLTGKAETFIVQTARHEELGDHVFIEAIDESGVVRLALPPKVANALASHRDSLTKRRRSIASRAQMKSRMERGGLPGFMRARRSAVRITDEGLALLEQRRLPNH
jgi:hypothetical protein